MTTGHCAYAQMVYADLVEVFDSIHSSSWPAHLLKVDQAGAVLLRAHEIIHLYEERIAAAREDAELRRGGTEVWTVRRRGVESTRG